MITCVRVDLRGGPREMLVLQFSRAEVQQVNWDGVRERRAFLAKENILGKCTSKGSKM